MKTPNIWRLKIILLLLMGLIVGCNSSSRSNSETTVFLDESTPPLQGGQVRQWAMSAEASSEFADPEWAAVQAIGAPDTLDCGDYQTAWATAGSDTEETLVLDYERSVHVTGINILQSFNPNQVVRVELVGVFDRAATVFEGQPMQVDQPCPYTLSIPIEKTEGRFSKVRVTVDQSVLGLGWNQIDAVELIGDID